jgi:TolA-binding protein
MSDNSPWHLDKRVPLALIVAIALQTAGAIWWAASINGEVQSTRQRVDRLDVQVEAIRNASQAQAVQLGRIEESVRGMRSDISRLIGTLERTTR